MPNTTIALLLKNFSTFDNDDWMAAVKATIISNADSGSILPLCSTNLTDTAPGLQFTIDFDKLIPSLAAYSSKPIRSLKYTVEFVPVNKNGQSVPVGTQVNRPTPIIFESIDTCEVAVVNCPNSPEGYFAAHDYNGDPASKGAYIATRPFSSGIVTFNSPVRQVIVTKFADDYATNTYLSCLFTLQAYSFRLPLYQPM